MKLRLVRDWDVALQPPERGRKSVGQFVGRLDELSMLSNELQRGPRRSILVCGHRGVGKTSLVYQALAAVYERDPESKFIPVLLNAAQFGAEDEAGSIPPERILENLIRRLYTASRELELPDELHDEIDNLYEKAAAREFSDTYRIRLAEARQEITEQRSRRRIDLSPRRIAAWLVGPAAALAIQTTDVGTGFLVDALSIGIAVAPVMGDYVITASRSSRSTETDESVAERAYALDNSLSNLEFDLERIHAKLAENGRTAIYVVDELDKLSVSEVVRILKFYKHLFTLSAAIFVFVGGEDLAERFIAPESTDEGPFRPTEYTYFRSHYFVARPAATDLKAFLGRVSREEPGESTASSNLEDFYDMLIFDARGDYFDLVQRLRDRITGFEEGEPVVGIGDFGSDDLRRIALERALRTVYEQKYHVAAISRWRENELVLRALYDRAANVTGAFAGQETDEQGSDTLEARATRDLNTLLHRLDMLESLSSQDTEIRGITVPIRRFRYTGRVPRKLPRTLAFRSEAEERFLSEFDRLIALLRRLFAVAEISRGGRERRLTGRELMAEVETWGVSVEPSLTTAFEVYDGLSSEQVPPRSFGREELETASREVEGATNGLGASAHNLVANALKNGLQDLEVTTPTQQSGIFALPGLDSFVAEARDQPATAVVARDQGKELIVFSSLGDDVVKRHEAPLRNNIATHRVLVIDNDLSRFRRGPRGVRVLALERDASPFVRNLKWVVEWLRA